MSDILDYEAMKQAIQADTSLDEAFAQTEFVDNEAFREGWKAWEWCRRQLRAKGLSEQHVKAMVSVSMETSRHIGTYRAIHACVYPDADTVTFIVG